MFGHARRTCLLGTAGTRVYALSLHDALPILRVGATVESGPTADIKPGNALPLVNIPTGTLVHNVELKPGKGGQLARSAGSGVQLVAKDEGYGVLRLPSGEMRSVPLSCRATIGQVGNVDHENISGG